MGFVGEQEEEELATALEKVTLRLEGKGLVNVQ
jgi:hypothetical protein